MEKRLFSMMLMLTVSIASLCAHTISGESPSYSLLSTSSSYGNVLYEGVYTCTGISRNSSGVSFLGYVSLLNVTVYEKALVSEGKVYPYQGNISAFGESGRKYSDGAIIWMVTGNGALRMVTIVTMTLPYVGTVSETSVLYYDKGDTRQNYQMMSNGNMGGSYNTPNNTYTTPTTPSRQPSCTICYGTGNCQTCYGSGWVSNPYVNERHPCTSCNSGGNSAYRGKCWKCHGTGKK